MVPVDGQYTEAEMRVALVSPYDLCRPGGVNTHVRQLQRHLWRLGHEATLIGPASRAGVDEPHVIPAPGGVVPLIANGSTASVGLSPGAAAWLGGVLALGRYDVVHIHEPLVPVLPLAALWRSRAANVGTFHAHYAGNRLHRLARPFLQPFFARLHARIAVSPAALRSAMAQFPAYYKLVPLAVDVAAFVAAEPLPRFADGKLNLLFVGRLDRRKGLRHLLPAFARVHRQQPETRLIVVAPHDEPAESRYRDLALGLGIAQAVVFAGPAAGDLARYYASADVFCSPALGGESFGMVLLEAMAAGLPIVATRIGGYRDVVREWGEGLLVPPADPEALAGALALVASHPDLRQRLRTEGRRTVEQYDWSRVAQRIVAVYEEALSLRHAKAA